MTVRELIDALKTMPQDAPIIMGWDDIVATKLETYCGKSWVELMSELPEESRAGWGPGICRHGPDPYDVEKDREMQS